MDNIKKERKKRSSFGVLDTLPMSERKGDTLFKRGGKALNIIFFCLRTSIFISQAPMERAQCEGMLACEEGAAPCFTPLSLGAAGFMSCSREATGLCASIPSFSTFALDLGEKE